MTSSPLGRAERDAVARARRDVGEVVVDQVIDQLGDAGAVIARRHEVGARP